MTDIVTDIAEIVEPMYGAELTNEAVIMRHALGRAADEIVRLRSDRSLARKVIEDFAETCSLALDIILNDRLRSKQP